MRALPSIGGVDFFYYICTSRDQLLNVPNQSLGRYFYFPGVFFMWSSLMRVVGFDLAFLQGAYIAALMTNIFLVGTIVFVITRTFWISLCTSTLYLFSAVYTEGVEGCTEIFCTIPFLLGIILWVSIIERGHRYCAMIVLGMLSAGALFLKQQAGLLLVGGLGFIPLLLSKNTTIRLGISQLFAASVTFIGSLLALFHLEGGGFSGLLYGLQGIKGYEQESSFYGNIQNLRPFFPLGGFVLVALVLWTLSIWRVKLLSSRDAILFSILGVCLIGGAATLYQFKTRGYLHYALLTDPSLAIVCSLVLFLLLRSITHAQDLFRVFIGVMGLLLCGGPLVYFWDQTQPIRTSTQSLYQRQTAVEIMEPYREVCLNVAPSSELFIFPPRRNIIHWSCQTKSTAWVGGYGWADFELSEYKKTLTNPGLMHVFVLDYDSIDYNQPLVRSFRGVPIETALAESGFSPSLRLASGTLFTR